MNTNTKLKLAEVSKDSEKDYIVSSFGQLAFISGPHIVGIHQLSSY